MAKYTLREPITHEEINAYEKNKQILKGTSYFTAVFYAVMLQLVPKVPNNSFYLQLDAFLNQHLFGDIMPKFSPDFYFSMKVAWCLSIPYSVVLFLVLIVLIHIRLKPKGVSIVEYLYKYDTYPLKAKLLFPVMALALIASGFLFSINPYAFESTETLTVMKSIDNFFYGNFFKAGLLFIFCHVFFIRGGMSSLILQIYYELFCKGDLRL